MSQLGHARIACECVTLVEEAQSRLHLAKAKLERFLIAVSSSPSSESMHGICRVRAITASINDASVDLLTISLRAATDLRQGRDPSTELSVLKGVIEKAITDLDALCSTLDQGINR